MSTDVELLRARWVVDTTWTDVVAPTMDPDPLVALAQVARRARKLDPAKLTPAAGLKLAEVVAELNKTIAHIDAA